MVPILGRILILLALLAASAGALVGFATSRADSTKSCTTGLSVLFFRVTIPRDGARTLRSTGNVFKDQRLATNCNKESGRIVTKHPVVSR